MTEQLQLRTLAHRKMCNKKTKPEFTKEQIAECKKCRHISGRQIWCGRFGVYPDFLDRLTILTPNRKIIRPFPENQAEYNRERFQRNYAVAVELCKGQGIVDEAVFIKRRQACAICPPEDKSSCGCAGCKQWHNLILKKLKCPKGRFENLSTE